MNVYERPPRTFLCLSKHRILLFRFDHIQVNWVTTFARNVVAPRGS